MRAATIIGVLGVVTGAMTLGWSSSCLAQPAERVSDAPTMLKEAQRGVFKIWAKVDGGMQVGTGVLLDTEGRACTNLHVIAGCSGVEVQFMDRPDRVPAELLAIDASIDLALIRLPMTHGAIRGARPLTMRESEVSLGVEVWALGYPDAMSITASRGVVSALRKTSEFIGRLEGLSDLSPTCEWVQTDCVLNPGYSGGPLVDEDGKIVGINTWARTDQRSAYFALSIKHVKEMLKLAPTAPIPFESAGDRLPESSLPLQRPKNESRDLENLPRIEISRTGKAQDVMRTTTYLKQNHFCRGCMGTGIVRERVRTGTSHFGNLSKPIYSQRVSQCRTCDGRKYAEEKMLVGMLDRAMLALCKLAIDDPKRDKAISHATNCIAVAFDMSEKDLSAMLNSKAAIAIADRENDDAKSLFFVGRLEENTPTTNAGRLCTVTIGDIGQKIALIDPVVLDAEAGDKVIVGAQIVRRMNQDDEQSTAVLQGGFVIAAGRSSRVP